MSMSSLLAACCLLACTPAPRSATAKAAFVTVPGPVPGLPRQGPPALAVRPTGDGRAFITSPVTGAAPASAPARCGLHESPAAVAHKQERGKGGGAVGRASLVRVRARRAKGARRSDTAHAPLRLAGRPILVGGPTFRKLIGQGYAQCGSELVPARPPPSAKPRREPRAADATAADLGAAAGSALGSEETLRTQGWRVLHVDDAILVVEKVGARARRSALRC